MDRSVVERFRLTLFGRMVMGVAHELDNHMSVVLGFAELIQMTPGNEKRVTDGSGKILVAAERVGTLVRQFSTYVRPHEPGREPFAPGEVFRDLYPFARYDLGRGNVVVSFPAEPPAGLLSGDRRDFGLILLCLLFNASEAMAATGGRLTLSVERGGDGWRFLVDDEGMGVPAGTSPDRLFEEGFSTKTGPGHAGLGLAVAKFLAGSFGGNVSLANRPEGGCRAEFGIPPA